MKKLVSILLIVVLIIAQMCLCVGCGESGVDASKASFGEDWLLNTYCYIKTFNPGEEEVIKGAFALAREYENKLSKTVAGSQVDRLNKAGAETGLNVYDESIEDLVALFIMSSVFNQLTDNQFDITVGNLTDIWDFTSGKGTVPSEDKIAEALNLTGFDKIIVTSDGEIHKESDNIKVDFGAIAKGYIADKVAQYLRANGVSSAIVSLGGNIVCVGVKPDQSTWQIGIEKPQLVTEDMGTLETRDSIGTIICPNDFSVVTSGTYERYILEGDKVYHHIIDPCTGYSADTDLVSATIIGQASVTCDALSTCCILLGADKAKVFMEEFNEKMNPKYEYVLVKADGEIIESSGVQLTK